MKCDHSGKLMLKNSCDEVLTSSSLEVTIFEDSAFEEVINVQCSYIGRP